MLLNREFIEKAEWAATNSPCQRRKYGAVITAKDVYSREIVGAIGWNIRQGRCCSGSCVRDRLGQDHARGIETGAEIHAEMMALLNLRKLSADYITTHLYLVGFDRKGNRLLGKQCRPCHMCAMLIKFEGFENVISLDDEHNLIATSIDQIIEDHEATYEPIGTL